MRYMLLIYRDEKLWEEMSAQQRVAAYQETVDFTEGLRRSGVYQGGAPLEHVSTATTVRMKQRIAANMFRINGVELAPAETTIAWGKQIIDFRAETTVQAIRKALAKGSKE